MQLTLSTAHRYVTHLSLGSRAIRRMHTCTQHSCCHATRSSSSSNEHLGPTRSEIKYERTYQLYGVAIYSTRDEPRQILKRWPPEQIRTLVRPPYRDFCCDNGAKHRADRWSAFLFGREDSSIRWRELENRRRAILLKNCTNTFKF